MQHSLYIYEQTTSTNDLARGANFRHGDAIWALQQSAGRGQRGNKWVGGMGSNATFSVVLEPTFLAATDQFYISQITALSLLEAMQEYGIESKIKWTNDIYVGDKKLAGILIENGLRDGMVSRSVVGIGLNVNQLEFDESLPNPTSMILQTLRRTSLEEVVRSIQHRLVEWCHRLEMGERDQISNAYRQRLYRLGEEHTFRRSNGEPFLAIIEGVGAKGELLLRHSNNSLTGYLFREVEFVIEARGR